MAGQEWHFVDGDRSIGPVSTLEIEEMLQNGKITGETLVWNDSLPDWQPAHKWFDVGATPPPVPVSGRERSYADQSELNSPVAGGLYPGAPARSFGEAISVCFSKYFTFSGRASRSEYWWFVLFYCLMIFAASLVEILLWGDPDFAPISGIVGLLFFVPSLSVTWRRLHDTNRSGWWYGGFWLAVLGIGLSFGLMVATSPSESVIAGLAGLFGLGCIIWFIAIFVFTVLKGNSGPNRFG